jgi:hypothetical protein
MKFETALCALIAGALFPSPVAVAGPPAITPQELIRSLYEHHQPKKGKEVDVCDKAAVAKYCDAALTELFSKECACRKEREETCNLDWDPFYDAQDFDASDPRPRIEKTKQAGSFDVTIHNLGERKLIYEMTQTPKGWRISNIRSPASKWSLREVLSGTQK